MGRAHRLRRRARARPVGGGAVDAGRRRVLRDAVEPHAGPRRHRGGQPARARGGRDGRSSTTCSPRPCCPRPLELGADVVVYSATKHIDGQGRVLGGAILGTDEYIDGPVQTLIRNTGPSLVAVQRVGAAQGAGDAVAARPAPDRVGPAGRRPGSRRSPASRGPLPLPAVAPAAPARARAAVRRRHGRHVRPRRARGRPARRRQEGHVRVARRAAGGRHLEQPRRRQVAGHAPGDHHAPQARARRARGGRDRGVDRAAVRRARGPGGPHRRPGTGAGHG